jgi:hypothetical protein
MHCQISHLPAMHVAMMVMVILCDLFFFPLPLPILRALAWSGASKTAGEIGG